MKNPNPPTNYIHSSSKWCALLCVSLLIAWLELLPKAQAVSPPPDGGYPDQNTAEGEDAFFNNTDGQDNVAVGYRAYYTGATGVQNVAIGSQALYNNTRSWNVAIGWRALYKNTNGISNTAIASTALYDNTIGNYNCAIGYSTLGHNIDGSQNIATGQWALYRNVSGSHNTATGFEALFGNTDGLYNVATGNYALYNNTTGDSNTGIGTGALFNNIGNNNVALGLGAGFYLSTGDNNIDIGNQGVVADANTIRIGMQGTQTGAFIAGISQTGVSGAAVMITTDGQLGVATSSARFKDEIKPMDKSSEAILALNPVTFRYKREIDAECTPQFGLVAEEVAQANPDLVVRDHEGKPYTVRYDAVNAMLLNEFLKEHRKVEKLEEQVAALTAGLQKVTAQVETSRPTRQVVVNQQ